MNTLEQFIEQVRAANKDWTDEQVATEADRLFAAQEPDPKPDPKPDDAAFARMRREKETAEREAQEAKDALAAKERKEAEDQGEWQKLAGQYETERDQARQETADAKQETQDLRTEIKVEKLAASLKFRNADEAIALLPSDLDRTDDGAVKAALEALAENRGHLIDNGRPGSTGRPAGGGGPDLTVEEVKAMSPEEVNRRWDEVQPVLAQQK